MAQLFEKVKNFAYKVEWTPRLYMATSLVGIFLIEMYDAEPNDPENDKISSADYHSFDWKKILEELTIGGAFWAYYFYSRFRKLEKDKKEILLKEKIAFGLIMIGFVIRKMAKRTLGKYFTYSLTIRKEHQIVDFGPYGIVRHPGYTGAVMQHIGYGLWFSNYASYIGFYGNIAIFLIKRIPKEEQLLNDATNGAYDEYKQRVKYRLTPFPDLGHMFSMYTSLFPSNGLRIDQYQTSDAICMDIPQGLLGMIFQYLCFQLLYLHFIVSEIYCLAPKFIFPAKVISA